MDIFLCCKSLIGDGYYQCNVHSTVYVVKSVFICGLFVISLWVIIYNVRSAQLYFIALSYKYIDLLLPMNCEHIALHAKCNHSATSIGHTLLHRPRQLSVISTYMHSEAEATLDRFVLDVLHKQFAKNIQQIETMELSLNVQHHWHLPS